MPRIIYSSDECDHDEEEKEEKVEELDVRTKTTVEENEDKATDQGVVEREKHPVAEPSKPANNVASQQENNDLVILKRGDYDEEALKAALELLARSKRTSQLNSSSSTSTPVEIKVDVKKERHKLSGPAHKSKEGLKTVTTTKEKDDKKKKQKNSKTKSNSKVEKKEKGKQRMVKREPVVKIDQALTLAGLYISPLDAKMFKKKNVKKKKKKKDTIASSSGAILPSNDARLCPKDVEEPTKEAFEVNEVNIKSIDTEMQLVKPIAENEMDVDDECCIDISGLCQVIYDDRSEAEQSGNVEIPDNNEFDVVGVESPSEQGWSGFVTAEPVSQYQSSDSKDDTKVAEITSSSDLAVDILSTVDSSQSISVSPHFDVLLENEADVVEFSKPDKSEEVVSIESAKVTDSVDLTVATTKIVDKEVMADSSKKRHSSMKKKRDRDHHHHHNSSKKTKSSSVVVKSKNHSSTLSSPPSKLTVKGDSVDFSCLKPRLTDLQILQPWRDEDVKLRTMPSVFILRLLPKVLHRLKRHGFVRVCSDPSRISNKKHKDVQSPMVEKGRERNGRLDKERQRSEKIARLTEQDRLVGKERKREDRPGRETERDERVREVTEGVGKERERDENAGSERTRDEGVGKVRERDDRERKRDEGVGKERERDDRERKRDEGAVKVRERDDRERKRDEGAVKVRERDDRERKRDEGVGQEKERDDGEKKRDEGGGKERESNERAGREMVGDECVGKVQNQEKVVGKDGERVDRAERERDQSADKEKAQVERRSDKEQLRAKQKRPWRCTASDSKLEKNKKRRIVRPFRMCGKVPVSVSPKKPKPVSVPQQRTLTIEENVSQDVFSSFESCPSMKGEMPGDSFLIDSMDTDAFDSSVAAFAADDVLIQARQVGQLTTDFSQLLNSSVVSTDVAKTMDFEDSVMSEDVLTSWPNDAGQCLEVGDVNSRARTKQDTDPMLSVDSSMKEYENYLDDCDFRGEMPPEKIDKTSDPSPDGLYKGTSPKKLEELKVQINGVVSGFITHSPVKLSPHNVMLSSSVCDSLTPASSSKEFNVKSGEKVGETVSTSQIGAVLLPSVGIELANSNASIDSKNNLSAPFAMTMDLDVAAPTKVQISPTSDTAQGQGENSYNSQCSDMSVQKDTAFASTTGGAKTQPNKGNHSDHVDSVWSLTKKKEVIAKQPTEKCNTSTQARNKHNQRSPQSKRSIPKRERQPVRPDSLSVRIAKELGTAVEDVDTLSLLASSLSDNSLLDVTEEPPAKRPGFDANLVDNFDASCTVSKTPNSRDSLDSNTQLCTTPVVPKGKSKPDRMLLELQSMKPATLIERYESCLRNRNHSQAIKIFNLLQSKIIDPLKYNMISNLFQAIVGAEQQLKMGFVHDLFQTVVKLIPSYNGNTHFQIQILRFMFSIFKKCQHLPSSVHNYLRADENEENGATGIVETYNRVLREAIRFKNAEVLHLYRDATEVGIELEDASLRSLLIVFHDHKLTPFSLDLYNLGCCMGIYSRIRIREWPHCLRLKTFYSENEMEVMIRDFFYKLAINLRSNPRFYDPRCITREEKFTIYIYLEELLYDKVEKGCVLDGIDCSLTASAIRVANVLVYKIDRSLAPYVMRRENDRIITVKQKGTIHLMALLLDAFQKKKSSHSSINFNQPISEHSIEHNPFKTDI